MDGAGPHAWPACRWCVWYAAQNLDWHTDPEIMKAIINFYTKVSKQKRPNPCSNRTWVHAACASWLEDHGLVR